MNNYKVILHFPEINNSFSVSIPAASPEEAMAQIHAGEGTILEVQEDRPVEYWDASKVYVETIHISKDRLDEIYAYTSGGNDCEDIGCECAFFPDEVEMSIFGRRSGSDGWMEAAFFHYGASCGCTNRRSKFEGLWYFRYDGILYITVVAVVSVPQTCNLTLNFPGVNDSISVSIPATSPEEALAQIHASGDTVLEAEEQIPSEYSEPVSKVYVETIHVSMDKLDQIYSYIFGKGDKDDVITETAVFPDGIEMDIKACGEIDDPGWTEAALFRNGNECGHTDCKEKFEGVWSIQRDGILYVTVVMPESSPWLSPNIITIPGSCLDSTAPVIAHQTNCKGVMGAGVALAIRERYPEVMAPYQAACNHENMLGKCQLIETEDGRYIANLFGQDGIGHGRQTDYDALSSALKSLVDKMKTHCLSAVSMPYNLGCGLAGGDWAVVSEILKDVFKDAPYIRLELWKL